MAKKVATKVTDAKNARQVRLIERLKKKEHWMKWAIIAALIIILLLLLFIGYVTDWTTGLRKDSNLSSLAADLDSSKTDDNADSGKKGTSGSDSNKSSNSGSTNTGTTNTGSSNTASESSNSRSSTSRTTTNNSSTTTNNNTTNNNGHTSSSGLVDLYADLNVGDTLDDVIDQANGLGIDVECENGLLIRNCTFTAGGASISTKSLLSTGLITSILKNF